MLKRITKYQNPSNPLPTLEDILNQQYTEEELQAYKQREEKRKQSKKSSNTSFVDAITTARDARTGAVGAQQIRDLYDKGENELASELSKEYLTKGAEGVLGTLMIPEFATYGALGGLARLGAGTAGSAAGSWLLGKAGEAGDRLFKTTWIKPVAQTVGGFAGFGAGMGATTPVLRRLATRGITLHMPQETFMKLRSEGFHKNADRVAKSLFKTKHIVNPEERLMNEITDVPKGKGWQFHVDDFYKTPNTDWETGRPISTSFNKQYYENGLIKPGKSYVDPSGESDYIWFKEDTPYIKPKHSNIIKGLSEDLNTKTNQLVSGEPNRFPLSKGFDPNKPSIEIYEYYPLGNIKMNPKLHLKDQSVGTWGKVKFHTPKQPQPSATTYEVKSLIVPKDRPITEAERLGIPKGERAKLSQDQLDALDDLLWWKQTGRHKTNFYFDETAYKFRWGTPSSKKDSEIGAVKALIDHGGSARSETSPIRLSTKKGNFVIWPNRNAGYSANFPVPDGMGWGPGEASISLVDDAGHEMKTILTSPRVDYINSMEDDMSKLLLESLSNKIDKDIIRRFWSTNEEMIKPGTYLSGDNHVSPLGTHALRTFDRTKSVEAALNEILYPYKKIEGGTGLSPDSYSSIIRQAARSNKKLRWGQGFTRWNPSAVENANIYNSWKQMQSGIISPEQYKEIFDAWAIPLGGRPAEIKVSSPFRLVKNNDGTFSKVPQFQTKTVIMPHPYIMYRKQGGSLKK